MKEQGRGGSIINTTSGAHFGNFGQTNYSAAKGAIASMTYTWSIELAKYGIRVNAIGPTGTTRMSDTFSSSENADDGNYPYIDPKLNGPLVSFLSSDKASNISGQIFGCGGDRLALMVQPHYGKTLTKEGGWSIQDIEEVMQKEIVPEFSKLGMLSMPYPFFEGVTPPAKSSNDIF
jgi:3-oxoacyl-[acyl-carrier protein] reductase